MWSYPNADPAKGRSADAACRPVHDYLVYNEFKYARRASRNQNLGLCRYGCNADEECRNSWLITDEGKWKGFSAMGRCY